MGTFLDSRHLRLVAEVARTGSVTRAADRLHVTQSAVSHQLREIESRIGTPLFHRSGRRMVPTAAGTHLAETAARVLTDIERAEAAVTQLARHDAGEFRLCSGCHTGYHWVPPLLEALGQRYPKVTVRLAPEHSNHAIGALLDGKLDLAIINHDPDDPRVRVQALFSDEHAAIVPPGHEWTRRAFVTPAQLGAARLFLYSRSLEESFVVRTVLRPAGVEPSDVTFLQLTEAIVEMVRAGLGLSVLPTWSIEPALSAGIVRAVRITRRGLFRPWYAATLAAAPVTPFATHLIDHLSRQGRRLGGTARPA